MDYDDNDFPNQNLHLAGEANNKFSPVLQPYALPKFDFDDTLNTHLRFDSLAESEGFLGIESNEDNNWIEDFSRENSGIVFSSGATESCAITRHINVWSEATSSESVEMLLNSVGQDEVIVRENTTKISDTSDVLDHTMEQMEPGKTCQEKSLSIEEMADLQPNPSVDDTLGDSSVLNTDAGQEQVLVKDASPTAAEESSMEEKNAISASNTTILEIVDTAGHDKIGSETNDSLLDQIEDKSNAELRIENYHSDATVQTVVTCSVVELKDEKTLLPETSNDENYTCNLIQSSDIHSHPTVDAQSVLVEAHSDCHMNTASGVENSEAENFGEIAKHDLQEMELSDVPELERRDQAFSTLEVSGQDVSGDPLVSSTHTSKTVEATLECAGELTTLTSSVFAGKPESPSQQHVIASEHEPTLLTETHTQIHLVKTPEGVYVSPMDPMVESTEGDVSKMSDNNEGDAGISNLKQSVELAVNPNDGDQDAKSSQLLSERVVSDSYGYVSEGSSSKLAESMSQSDPSATDNSGTMIHGKECEAIPLNPGGLQNLSQDGAPDVSLTSSIESHILKPSSDGNELGSFSETDKVASGEPETGPPVDASSSGSQMDQQARKHTDDVLQSTQSVEGGPASEGSKDAVDVAVAGQVLLQQSEGTGLEGNIVPEVVDAAETQSLLDTNDISERPNTSSSANLGSEVGKDGSEEEITAKSGGIMTAVTPVSHPKGDAIEKGDSRTMNSELSVKPHVTETENAATNLGTPLLSFPTVKYSETPVNKIEKNSVTKPEDQNISTSKSVESPVLNRNEVITSGVSVTSDLQKATLLSPIMVGSPSISSLEKTAAKSSKPKSERKPRRTSKSAGKEASRKGTTVKGEIPFQHFQSGGNTNAIHQSSAGYIQMTQSTEKQQSLHTPAQKAVGTLSTPTASLPDLNSSSFSSISRRTFTDLQQVQLRAQIFVYGALIQGTAPDEAYMIAAFGGPDGGKGSWEKAWRACVVRAQKLLVATPETPLQSRAGKSETPSVTHTSSKESSATNPIIPLSPPLWSLSTSVDALQASSVQRGSASGHQPLPSSSHAHQTSQITPAWMSPLPYRTPWLTSPQTSGFDIGSRFPVYPITEPVKLTPVKELSLPYSGAKHVKSGTSSNVFKGPPALEPTNTVLAPSQHSTGMKSRKRKKMPVSVEPSPSILNSLKQTELAVSPLVSMSTSVLNATALAKTASSAGTLPSVISVTAVPMNLVSTFPEKKSFPSPLFVGNLVPEVKQRSILSEDTVGKLKEAKIHAEDASALAATAVSNSEYVWKQIELQRNLGLQPESQSRLALAAVAIAAAAAVAKAAAAAANVAANAALQAKLMAEEASLPSSSVQGNEPPKSTDYIVPGQGTTPLLKSETAAGSSSLVLIAARETAKKRVEAATAATKRAENMDSIVKAAELASEAVSQAGILVSMGHPPSLSNLVQAGPSNYWRQAQESQEAQPTETGVLEKETAGTSDRTFASPRTVQSLQTELDGSLKKAVDVTGPVSAIKKETKGQNGADLLAKNIAVVSEPEAGSKSLIDIQTESEQMIGTTNDEDIKEGSNVEVFKEEPGLRTAWYSANVLSLEDDKAYVLFSDLSVEQGTDKLKEWVALKGEGDEAPKIRSARSMTAVPYEGTRKRRRAVIGDRVWKIGDRVDSWVHDCWLEGVITEKNKKDENTVTVHFPAQGDTLTIKAWNLRPSLVWKDGKWSECCSSGDNSSHEGDTPKEKRPRLGIPALVTEGKDTSAKIVDNPAFGKLPETGVLDLGVSGNTFNIGRSTTEENKPVPLRMKRTGLQKQGSKVIFGVPKPGKKRKFMEVSKHYVTETSSKTRERREPTKPLKPAVTQNLGSGSWRMPSKNVSRDKQTITSKPKTSKAAPKTKERPGAAASRTIPRKDLRESDDAADQNAENKDPASGTVEESSSQDTNRGKGAPATGRLAKIEEDKALAEKSSKTSDGMEPRRSVRRIQPTSRLLEGLQTSMMTSKIPSVSHSKSHQSQNKK